VTWRELEVELVDGDDELLAAVTERLLAAGAVRSASASKLGRVLEHRLTAPDGRPSPDGRRGRKAGRKKRTAGAVVLTALADQVHALQRADLQVRAGEPEGVHDLRVACRRLRAVLAAFRPVLDQERTDPLRDELRWLGGQLSPARDGEVALEHLRRLVADLPPELVLGPVAARLQQAAIAGGETARRAAERTLRGDRYLALLDGLFDVLERPPLTAAAGEPADDLLTAAIRRAGKRLARRTAAAGAEPSAMHLHAVRKAVKRTRYTAEVVGGRRARALVDVAEEAQDLLGAAQDTSATREQCRRLGVAAFAAGENAWTYGLLHGLEQARADRSVAAFWALAPALGEAVARASGRKG
jgi:CHAD domain-containing protein